MSKSGAISNSFWPLFVGLIGLAFALFVISNPSITGLILFDAAQNDSFQGVYTEELNLYAAESSAFNWTPLRNCSSENCSLKFVNISAVISGNTTGNVSISLLTSSGAFLLFTRQISNGTNDVVKLPTTEVTVLNNSVSEPLNETVSNNPNATLNNSITAAVNLSIILNNSNVSVQNESIANESAIVGADNLSAANASQVDITNEANVTVEEINTTEEQGQAVAVASEPAANASGAEVIEQVEKVESGILTGAVVAVAVQHDLGINDSDNFSNDSLANNIAVETLLEFQKELFINNTCVETCALSGVNDTSFIIFVNVSPEVSVNITSLTYGWQEAANPSSQNKTVILNLSSFSKVAKWSYLRANRTSIMQSQGRFDGGADYELFPEADQISFANNSFAVALNVTIEPENSYGTLVSKHDYSIGKRFEIGVNPEGTIRFTLSDSNAVINIETVEMYNDNAAHEIVGLLTPNSAFLFVDDILKAEADSSKLQDLNSTADISIGADAGQIPWTGKTFDNFRGFIKEVGLYGN